MLCNENRSMARQVAVKQADQVFVSTPDLLEFIPNSIWLPQPVDVSDIDALAPTNKPNKDTSGTITIAHAPTSTNLKGSSYVEEAINELQSKGLDIELHLLTGLSHKEVISAIHHADIVIDQLLTGSYGVVSIEAMALGKPVICYIREDMVEQYDEDLPIVSASPLDLVEKLSNLIEQRAEWPKFSAQSKAYVRRVHHVASVSKKLICYY